ncbi:unnamed protein product [Lymnaea stagnalis]|uniref:Hexosyltransferase n=1 Tax=Lymnaea stagnalis TaxID=6523 RepID=A0AAV2I2Z5_LYMST
MKNFEVIRHTMKQRKRSIRCKVFFVVMLSLVGYAFTFSHFSLIHPNDDQQINHHEATMERDGRRLETFFEERSRQETDKVLILRSQGDTNLTNLKVSELDEMIRNETKPEEDLLQPAAGRIQHKQENTEAVFSEKLIATQRSRSEDVQNGPGGRLSRSVGDDKKIVRVNLEKQTNGDIVKTVSSLEEPSMVTKDENLVPKSQKRNKTQKGMEAQKDASSGAPSVNEILKAELEAKMARIELLSQPVINDHSFEYIRNPVNACAFSRTEVLFIVPSAPENFQRRANTRKGAQSKYAREPSNNSKMVFFIGRPACGNDSAKIQAQIDDEFQTHRDIVQENFEDVYKNIRLKAVSMLKWTTTFCKEARFVIRTDDDVTVNVPKIVSVMEAKSRLHSEFILGDRKDGWKPVRKVHARFLKYFVSEEEYPDPTYPPFAVGGLLGYPLSTVSLLYQAALRVKPLWLDDVFITGICAVRLRIPLLKDPDFVFKHPKPTT